MGDNGAQDVVVAQSGQVDQRDRHERPVEAKDDQAHPEGTDEGAAQEGADHGQAKQQCEELTEQVGDERGDGANDQVAKGDGDGDDDQRGEEHLHRSGHPLLNPVLEGRTEPDHEKDGDNGAGVTRGRHDERQAQERGVPREGAGKAELHGTDNLARGQGNHGGIDQGKGDGHAVELAHLELLGRSKAKHHGQEVEHAVSDGVEQRIGAVVGKARDQEGSERQQALHDTGSGEGAEHGGEDARDEVDDHIGNALGSGIVVIGVDGAAVAKTAGLENGVVDVLDDVAHNNLVLTVGVHDLDDVGQLGDCLVIGLRLVLQLKTNTGNAVCDAFDVGLTANQLYDLGSKIVVFTCHDLSSLFQISTKISPTASRYLARS